MAKNSHQQPQGDDHSEPPTPDAAPAPLFSVQQVKREVSDARFQCKVKVTARERVTESGVVCMVAHVAIGERLVSRDEYARFVALKDKLGGVIPESGIGRFVGATEAEAVVEPGLFVVTCAGATTGPVGREQERVASVLLREAIQVLAGVNAVAPKSQYPESAAKRVADFLFKAQRLGFEIPSSEG